MNNSYKKAMDKIELSEELKEKIINNALKPQDNKVSKFRTVYVRRITGIAACFVFCFISYYAVTNYYMKTPENILSADNPKPISNIEVSGEKTEKKEPVKELVTDSNSKKATVTKPPVYEKAKVNNNQIETASPKQEASTENNSPVPPFAKGKKAADVDTDNIVSQKATVEEISAVLGYEIKSPQDVPTGYTVSDMSVLEESIAEIKYQGDNDIITYRTAKLSEDLSQKNDVYEFMEIMNINNIDVVLKGREESYCNAVWSDNTETFSITSDNGVEKSIMVEMVMGVDYTNQTDADNENN